MKPSKKGLLYQLAEETAYSSKGHFKTADWISTSTKIYISVPLITSAILLVFKTTAQLSNVLSFFGFSFSLFAMVSVWASNKDTAGKAVTKHLELGNKYLELHKELRSMIGSAEPTKLEALQKRIAEVDHESSKFPISFAGRSWSKIRINSEMDLDWMYN